MSNKNYKENYVIDGAVNGQLTPLIDAEYLNFLSFHGKGVISGGTVDVTFQVRVSNYSPDAGRGLPTADDQWEDAGTIKKQFVAASSPARFYLEVPWAAGRYYCIKVIVANGTVDAMTIYAYGKG